MRSITLIIILVLIFFSCEKKNEPPTCKITNPINGAEFVFGETITITVDADDSDGNITEVRFYINGDGVSSSSSFPYKYEWNTSEVKPGPQEIKVTAIDNDGGSAIDAISLKDPFSGMGDLFVKTVYESISYQYTNCWLYDSYDNWYHYEFLDMKTSDQQGEVFFQHLLQGWYYLEAEKILSSLFTVHGFDSVYVEAKKQVSKIVFLTPKFR